MIRIHTNFNNIDISNFNVNDCPYYILNLTDDITKISKISKSDVVFSNLYTHYNNNLIDLLTKEFNNNKLKFSKINIINERTNLIEYTDIYIKDTYNLIDKFKKYEIIEIPLFFIKSFYSKLNNYTFIIFKSIYFNKYIDCMYALRIDAESTKLSENKLDANIDSFNKFEEYFNENNSHLLNYINKISEASNFVDSNNFYGVKFNNYLKEIEEHRLDIIE